MESTVTAGDRLWTVQADGQCTPIPAPRLGTFKLVAGNGTSVGTVMTLVCPLKHRAISGGLISCVQESNITDWVGGIPECKLVTAIEGFRLALLLSIISAAIIFLMSIVFFTSWLLKCVKKEEVRQWERLRREENDRLWHQVNEEEQRESFYTYNVGPNHNNNNNNSDNRTQQQGCFQNYPDPRTLHYSQSSVGYMPSVRTDMLCVH